LIDPDGCNTCARYGFTSERVVQPRSASHAQTRPEQTCRRPGCELGRTGGTGCASGSQWSTAPYNPSSRQPLCRQQATTPADPIEMVAEIE